MHDLRAGKEKEEQQKNSREITTWYLRETGNVPM